VCITQTGASHLFVEDCKVIMIDDSSTFLNITGSSATTVWSNVWIPDNKGKIFNSAVSFTMVAYNCFLNGGVASTSTLQAILTLDTCHLLNEELNFSGSFASVNILNSSINNITSTATTSSGSMNGGDLVGTITWPSGQTFILENLRLSGAILTGGGTFIKYSCIESTSLKSLTLAKLANAYAGSDFFVAQNTVTTTDATPTLITGFPLGTTESYTVTARVAAANSAHTAFVGGSFTAGAQRAGGNISLVTPGVIPTIYSTGLGTFAVVDDITSQSVAVEATGEIGVTYNWVVTFEYQRILTSA
jgi:hypothetical protein